MISQTAEYALRAMVFLGDHKGQRFTADKLSAATKVPARYLSKIMQQLVKADLVTSLRGPTGGFGIDKELDDITVLEVVRAVEKSARITQCPLGLEDHGTKLCNLHRLLDQAAATLEQRFARVTIAGLLRTEEGGSHPLCSFPRHPYNSDEPVLRR